MRNECLQQQKNFKRVVVDMIATSNKRLSSTLGDISLTYEHVCYSLTLFCFVNIWLDSTLEVPTTPLEMLWSDVTWHTKGNSETVLNLKANQKIIPSSNDHIQI